MKDLARDVRGQQHQGTNDESFLLEHYPAISRLLFVTRNFGCFTNQNKALTCELKYFDDLP